MKTIEEFKVGDRVRDTDVDGTGTVVAIIDVAGIRQVIVNIDGEPDSPYEDDRVSYDFPFEEGNDLEYLEKIDG